jgi:hypothetical protein
MHSVEGANTKLLDENRIGFCPHGYSQWTSVVQAQASLSFLTQCLQLFAIDYALEQKKGRLFVVVPATNFTSSSSIIVVIMEALCPQRSQRERWDMPQVTSLQNNN